MYKNNDKNIHEVSLTVCADDSVSVRMAMTEEERKFLVRLLDALESSTDRTGPYVPIFMMSDITEASNRAKQERMKKIRELEDLKKAEEQAKREAAKAKRETELADLMENGPFARAFREAQARKKAM